MFTLHYNIIGIENDIDFDGQGKKIPDDIKCVEGNGPRAFAFEIQTIQNQAIIISTGSVSENKATGFTVAMGLAAGLGIDQKNFYGMIGILGNGFGIGNRFDYFPAGPKVNDGKWHSVLISWKKPTLEIYIDDALTSSTQEWSNLNKKIVLDTTKSDNFLGGSDDQGDSTEDDQGDGIEDESKYYFEGRLKHVIFYNDAHPIKPLFPIAPSYSPSTVAPSYSPSTVAPSYSPSTVAPSYSPSTVAPTATLCKRGFVEHKSRCYYFTTLPETLDECKEFCISQQSSMLCIRDLESNNYLFSILNANYDWMWIGYSCNGPGTCTNKNNWQWINGCDSKYVDRDFSTGSTKPAYAYAVIFEGRKFWESIVTRTEARCACEYNPYSLSSQSLLQKNIDVVDASLMLANTKSSTSSNSPTSLITSDHDTAQMYVASIIIMFAVLFMCYYFVGKGNGQHEYTPIVDTEDNTNAADKM